ncbi:MAG: DNA replication and repair protein RecF [Spirochaetaceae bacterium]|jgi:DNA replication and repair protein RecF|nr:DNA replication and repair protein RecF [Spirochaetaceae bacterium]
MPFFSLRTSGFRNLVDAEVDIRGKDIFLIGENGQGKTNFLEALYFCSYASSFRGVRDNEIVRLGEKNCSVSVTLGDSLFERILIKVLNDKKTVEIDGKQVEDRKDLLSVAPCIVFCHDDMEFIAGSPERRRWFFDQCQSLYDPVYLDDLRKYRKVLKTRNAVLKEGRGSYGGLQKNNLSLLDTLDPQMAVYGLRIMEKREESVRYFSEVFGPLYAEVSGIGGIAIRYAPSWKAETVEGVESLLEERREGDMAAGTSLHGPHRDRYIFTCEGLEFAGKASTGQRRLLALLLRIAEARRFSQMNGKNPILLLDDVLLELDPQKRRKFLSVMPDYDQAFYTFLPEERIDRYNKPDTLVYTVSAGYLLK